MCGQTHIKMSCMMHRIIYNRDHCLFESDEGELSGLATLWF